jgi:hypothetical protein
LHMMSQKILLIPALSVFPNSGPITKVYRDISKHHISSLGGLLREIADCLSESLLPITLQVHGKFDMSFTLDKVVPWGRSYDEYLRMFALTQKVFLVFALVNKQSEKFLAEHFRI